ncbi:phosphatase PAP2 family protein [Paracoccus endophyticus]|uniref:phosphatase PAP2 family protein n=1 Tax=Paracoccus endophyticus TaxID=2233774 RepID=UPI000DD9BD25|nr:phosphatase PAP2 family protein [Paracoccus endophyticus]
MSETIVDRIEDADVALSVEAGQWRDHPAVQAAGILSEIADQPPAYALSAAALGAGLVLRHAALAEGGARALASVWLATRIKAAIKSRIVRTRPTKLLEEGEYRTGVDGPDEHDYNSFPSGHTADAVAGTRAAARVAPGAALPLAGLAVAIGVVQVPRARHHLADVVAGAAVGWLAEACVDAAFRRLRLPARLRAGLAHRGGDPAAMRDARAPGQGDQIA